MESKSLDGESLSPSSEKLFEFLKLRIKGQDDILKSFVKKVSLSDSGLHRKDEEPLHIALLIGPSKSGKKLLVKSLAEYMFNNSSAFTYIPGHYFFETLSALTQNEVNIGDYTYQENNNPDFKLKAKLYHSDFEAISELEKLLQQNPNNKDLQERLDKAEKSFEASSNIFLREFYELRSIIFINHVSDLNPTEFSMLMELLEHGVIATKNGRVSFKNSIIFISCSNVVDGEDRVEQGEGIGFRGITQKKSKEDSNKFYLDSRERVEEYFSPRFLSLVDRVYMYRPYEVDAYMEILKIELARFHTDLVKKYNFPVVIKMSDEVKKFIAEESLDNPALGIKLLKSKFDKYIRLPLGRMKDRGLVKAGDKLVLKVEEKTVKFYKESRPSL